MIAIGFAGTYLYKVWQTPIPAPEPEQVAVEPDPVPEPTLFYGYVVDSLDLVEGKVKRNQNLSEILLKHNVSGETIHELAIAAKPVYDVRRILPRKKYTLICERDSLQTARALVYEPNRLEYVIFNFSDSAFVRRVERKVEIVEKVTAGTISNSLAVSMSDQDLSPQLTNDFADIFAWEIDFFHLYPGDQFKVIYEDKMVEGQSVGIGRILGAYFQHDGEESYAIYLDQGNGPDYFDREGNSLRKQLLKYPLKFNRISSRYSGRRYHPVLKRYKAHRGTDFAADRGTPIRSVGEGVVTEARYGKYNGNYVKIKHNGIYSTQYLHMSKIAKGIRPGTKVKQGQTIGYVGSTGLARGNHLCFRFWKNGYQVDALNVNLPPSEPVTYENRIDYEVLKDRMVNRLNKIPLDSKEKLLAKGV